MALFMQWRTFSFQDPEALDFMIVAAACNISVYDVALSYTNGTYNLTNRTLSAQNRTMMLFLPFVNPYFTNFFVFRLVINPPNTTAGTANDWIWGQLSHQISQWGIGLNVGLFMPTQTMSDIAMQKAFLGSRYQINTLSLLWASAGFYLIVSVGLLARAANKQGELLPIVSITQPSTSDSNTQSVSIISMLALAQRWVASPFAIIAEHFVPSTLARSQSDFAPTLSTQKDTIDTFGDDTGTDRLGIGFQDDLSLRLSEGLRRRGKFFVSYQDQLMIQG
jgi:hypothetical protein